MNTNRVSRVYGVVQSTVFIIFALVILLDRSRPLLVSQAPALRWLGTGFAVAGVVVMLVAIRTIGRSIQIEPAPKATATLTTSGIYRWLRHPIYTGIVLIVIGLFLRQCTVLVAAAAIGVVGFLLVKSRFEERLLLARYPEYARYRRRSWGIVPFL